MARVVNVKDEGHDVYIGRKFASFQRSKWANPFPMKGHGARDRERVIQRYRDWIVTQPELMAALPELIGKRLGCWCAPLPCHGDVLVELIEETQERKG